MRTHELRVLFRRVLALGVFPSAAFVACGGSVTDVAGIGAVDAGPGGDTGNVKNGGRTTTTVDVDASVTVVKKDGGTVVLDAAVMEDADVPDVIDTIDTGIADARFDVGCVDVPPPPPADAGFLCSYQVPLPCSVNPFGAISQTDCKKFCGNAAFGCYAVDPTSIGGGDAGIGGGDATWVLECYSCAAGRRPEGFVRAANDCGDASDVGRYFAIMAELEAASVFSFERLARELAAHGAPASLVKRARRAADDERRHARVAGALASRFGGKADLLAEGPSEVRSLEAMALENAVEGCVRETFGALSATLQGERAPDPRVRAALRRIAVDETSHARLAWDVAAWLETRLGDEAKARVAAASQAAVRELRAEVGREQPDLVRAIVGLPDAAEATRMVDAMSVSLWAA